MRVLPGQGFLEVLLSRLALPHTLCPHALPCRDYGSACTRDRALRQVPGYCSSPHLVCDYCLRRPRFYPHVSVTRKSGFRGWLSLPPLQTADYPSAPPRQMCTELPSTAAVSFLCASTSLLKGLLQRPFTQNSHWFPQVWDQGHSSQPHAHPKTLASGP